MSPLWCPIERLGVPGRLSTRERSIGMPGYAISAYTRAAA
jgi:hypothetical protein